MTEQGKKGKIFQSISKKSRKGNSPGVLISGPTSFRPGGIHVDREFNWVGDPKDAFELQCKLGEGAYGAVYKAIMKATNAELAIKSIGLSQQESESIQEEMTILKECRDPNIVCYYGCAVPSSQSLWILMDLCEMGSIYDIMQTRPAKCFTEEQIGAFMGPVLGGLNYLHSKNIIHRDIKAANIMVNAAGVVKIGDFGISAQISEGKSAKAKTVIGTPLFMAPEVIEGKQYTHNSDVWSLGITAIECAEGRAPRDELTALRAMYVIVNESAPILRDHGKWSSDFYNFVSICLQKNPNRRPPAQTLLKDVWIEKSSAKAKETMLALLQSYNRVKKGSGGGTSLANSQGFMASAFDGEEMVLTGRQMVEEEEIEVEAENVFNEMENRIQGSYLSLEKPSREDIERRGTEERVTQGYLTLEKPEPEERVVRGSYLTMEKEPSQERLEEVVETRVEEVEEKRGGGGYLTLERPEAPSVREREVESKIEKKAIEVRSAANVTLERPVASQSSVEEKKQNPKVDINDLTILLEELSEWRKRTEVLEDKIKQYIAMSK